MFTKYHRPTLRVAKNAEISASRSLDLLLVKPTAVQKQEAPIPTRDSFQGLAHIFRSKIDAKVKNKKVL